MKSPGAWQSVLRLWFDDEVRPKWFLPDPAFDRFLRKEFLALHEAAARGALDDWMEQPESSLALVILLDQAPRNIFRGTPRAYATDAKALSVARYAVTQGLDRDLNQEERLFLYLPFEHSEDLADQEQAVRLMTPLDEDPTWLDYAEQHRDIIARFGRFPHRNAILGRESTPEELAFLKLPGSSF